MEEDEKGKSNPFDECFKGIFSKKLSKTQVLPKVGKFQFTRSDLQSFDPKTTLNRLVIDACLRFISIRTQVYSIKMKYMTGF